MIKSAPRFNTNKPFFSNKKFSKFVSEVNNFWLAYMHIHTEFWEHFHQKKQNSFIFKFHLAALIYYTRMKRSIFLFHSICLLFRFISQPNSTDRIYFFSLRRIFFLYHLTNFSTKQILSKSVDLKKNFEIKFRFFGCERKKRK